jgi:hypothetical protein
MRPLHDIQLNIGLPAGWYWITGGRRNHFFQPLPQPTEWRNIYPHHLAPDRDELRLDWLSTATYRGDTRPIPLCGNGPDRYFMYLAPEQQSWRQSGQCGTCLLRLTAINNGTARRRRAPTP